MDEPMAKHDDDSQALVSDREHSFIRRLLAWGVHFLTASGVVWSLLALEATFASQWRQALGWLVLAVIVDSVDGTLARLVSVKQVVPKFDGTLLDSLVDYINYVVVPALIIHRAELVPERASFGIACAICLASAFQFCQHGAKTPDHFFKGFPSYWNVAALYLLSLGLEPLANLAIVTSLVVMVFVPIKYLYVTRTVEYRSVTLLLTVLWAAMAITILWQLPDPQPLLVWASMLYFVYYFCMSLYLTFELWRQPS
jgi:phosphatidylcholine synthase